MEASAAVEGSREPVDILRGRILPLNSRRLTSTHLKQVAEALKLPTTGSPDQLRQLVEGKLESEEGREVNNVQVVVQENSYLELKLSLIDEGGVFLETNPLVQTKPLASSEWERLQEVLDEANRQKDELSSQLASAEQKLEEEKKQTASLTEQLSRRDTEATEHSGSMEEIRKLREELQGEKEKYKQMWRMSCTQSREQEELLAALEVENERLRASNQELLALRAHRSGLSSEHPSGPASPVAREHASSRRGKAPPVENPETGLDDWLPALERASTWNGWSEEELLIQLAGHLRGRALQEWNLLGESNLVTYDSAVKALRSRLDPGSKAMAVQDFRHCSQAEGENVSDFIRRLERTFRLAYGRDNMATETRDALMYGQLQEGVRYNLMEAPAVSGATDYTTLCLAARNEERRQADLKKRKRYQSDRTFRPSKKLPDHPIPTSTPQPFSMQELRQGRVEKPRRCWNCEMTGHMAKDCREPKKESTGRTDWKAASTKMIQSGLSKTTTESRDDPLQYLLSSDSDSGDSVRQVRVYDQGSKPHRVKVSVQGVPMYGVVDSGADITIIGGEMFKRVATVAKLHKKDFKLPDKTPRNYDQQPFHLDGRMDLDVSFLDKTMKTPVYVKMDAPEQLLLSEGVCRQLGIISYHPEVEPRKLEQKSEHGPSTDEASCQVPTVRVQLVQSVRLPPSQSVVAEVRLVGDSKHEGPLILESDATLTEKKGVQIADALVLPTRDGTAKILLTNCLGISQRAEAGEEVGMAFPAELIDPPPGPSTVPCMLTEQPTWDPDEALRTVSHWGVREITSSDRVEWRRQQLRELLAREFKDSSLPKSEMRMLSSLLEEYHEVFSLEEGERGETDLVELHINTGDAPPTTQRARRIPFAVRQEVARQLRQMQNSGVIQPSDSPWASPIVLVQKKDGTMRFCVDYRGLNAVTKPDKFPLPRIDDLLDQLGKAEYFSTLDLAAGYWQIGVDEESREKTAFVTHQGLFEFRVMPFGLTNAPAVFQRLMHRVLSGRNPDDGPAFVEVYIDDVLVFSRTIEEHVEHLRRVLEQLRRAGLKLKPAKCHFIRQSVEYLGHVITPSGLRPNPKQVVAVQEFPIPESVSQVRQFLGLTSYYRRFIKNFAATASPLHSLTKKNAEFVWTEECRAAFELLKTKLTEAPVLAYPTFDVSFVLETDASIKGLGAVLSQKQEDTFLHPVAYASRALSAPEKNYSITELETLAVVWAIQHFHAYLYGHEVSVITDHSAVRAILETPSPSGKHARWWLKVFASGVGRVHIVYRPGRENAKADALSRNPVPSFVDEQSDLDVQVDQIRLTEKLKNLDVSQLLEIQPQEANAQPHSDFGKEQRKDQETREMIEYLEKGILPDDDRKAKKIAAQAPQFAIVNGILYFVDAKHQNQKRAVVPTHLRERLMQESHGGVMAGHFSGNRLFNTLSRHWWWETIYRDSISHCKNCAECAVVSGTGRVQRPPLHPIPVQRPFQILGVDIMELPVTESGNKYVIVFQDFLTKWPLVYPAPDQKAERIVRLLTEEIVPMFGVPEALLSDRGTNLLAHIMQDVCRLLGIAKLNTSSYHPQCDGMVERLNRTLKAMLRMSTAKFGKQWDQFLPGVLWAYRNTPHESTQEKPSFLLFGMDLRSPMEAALLPPEPMEPADLSDYREELILSLSTARELAVSNIRAAQRRYKNHYDKKSRRVTLKLGDWVLVRFPRDETGKQRKLSRPWHGPYRITQRNDPDVTVVKVYYPEEGPIQIHQSRVCPCPP